MASSKSQRQARARPASRNSPKSAIATRKAESIGFGGGHVFLLLLVLRILNALTIKTFFQPDEYYQSLEPAWRLAFGADSGAWITWVGAH
jgi:phosphatidylinositol glycan class B